ncbi:MAG: hypothetical protein A2Z24_01970 [Candidatus Woykebacteria bacterium RBG_16_44_10]|uniref:Sortase n=1 Tax=Candidatus Woykebacteria bacterium RBG_16_44_10 TaxID=1802597 RepID=A0A1G1WCV3_9BACT|nr:MAG: hypothetical protein A2Z24_01970 [Candidatus Woykebacteria bacterium RBG_16_44_10]
MTKRKRFWIFLVVRTAANALVITGVVFSFMAFSPFVKQEIWYWWKSHFETSSTRVEETTQPAKVKAIELPSLSVEPESKEFGIVIEKIGVNTPVVANVNPSSYPEYIEAMTRGVAHARGTAFPGSAKAENNNVFLFAHSAMNRVGAPKYNSVFYLLRKLEAGDRVTTFYQGKRYDYVVADKKVVQATDIQYLTEPSKEPILTLQTCDPPGMNIRRLIVTAKLVQ